jgi:hypothetical protein
MKLGQDFIAAEASLQGELSLKMNPALIKSTA